MPIPRAALAASVLLASAAVAACGGTDAGGGPPKLTSRQVAAPPLTAAGAVPAGPSPAAIAVDGRVVWVVANADGTARRLDGRTGRPLPGRARVGGGPVAVAARGGAAWVAAADGTIARLEAASGARVPFAGRVTDPAGIAVGDGAVWVTSRSGGAVVRLDPVTGRRLGAPIRVGRGPTDIVLRDGTAWVANSAAGTVSRIDTATGRADPPQRVARRQVLALAADSGGVWAAITNTSTADPIAVVGLDPGTARATGDALRVPGGIPLRLAAGAGSVWATDVGAEFASARGDARAAGVIRIDPRRAAVAGAPIRVGARPGGIAVGAGAVWVANAGDGTVSRIPLAG